MGLMYTPHTVTVVNAYDNAGTMVYQETVLPGVFLDVRHSALAAALGASNADSAELYIPMDINAQSAAGNARSYISPKEFRAAADKTPYWTLEAADGNSASPCFFIRGKAQGMSYKNARKANDDVFNVTSVLTRDFGSRDMWHWQVGGR